MQKVARENSRATTIEVSDPPVKKNLAIVSAISVAVSLRDVDLSRHVRVLDVAASLALDAQILADLVDLDRPRSVVLHDDRSLYVRGEDPAGSIRLDDERAGDVPDIDVTRAVLHPDVATDVLDGEVAGSVGDPHGTGGADHRQRSRAVTHLERADVEDFSVTTAVPD